jgi:hypothetical protein
LTKQTKENKESKMLLEAVTTPTRWLSHFPPTFLPSWFNNLEVMEIDKSTINTRLMS